MLTPLLGWLGGLVRDKTLDVRLEDNRVDMSWLDRMTPFEEPVHPAQTRLAEVEQLLADHARSEGRAPSGSVKQQVEALIDRLHEQDKQSI